MAISDGADSTQGLVTALTHAGLYSAVAKLVTRTSPTDDVSQDAKWECAWRLSNWDTHETEGAAMSPLTLKSFHRSVYYSMLNLDTRDSKKVNDLTNSARTALFPFLQSWQNANLGKLSLLSELDTACTQKLEKLLSRWRSVPLTTSNSSHELVLAGRCSILQRMLQSTPPDDNRRAGITVELSKLLVERSTVGRVLGVAGISESSLHAAAALVDLSPLDFAEQTLESARFAMATGQLLQAQHTLQKLLAQFSIHNTNERLIVYCRTLLLQGEVLLKTRALPATKVLDKNYRETISLLSQAGFAGTCTENFSDYFLFSFI